MDVDAFASQLTAARTGADWAWERIYRSLAPSVIGYLRAQGASEPEDVAGEVFVQIVRQVDVAKLGREVAAMLALARSGRLLRRG